MSRNTIYELEQQQQRARRECAIRQVLHTLEDTLRLQDSRPIFTDASAQVVAPLVEAVEILEAIIWASDGCLGHRHCVHSMEPWQRARALLAGKWQAYEDHRPWPSADATKEDTLP